MPGKGKKHYCAYGIIVIIILGYLVDVWGGVPTEQIKEKADEIMNILNDPAFMDKKEEKKELIVLIIDQMIDWPGVARRTLGLHWRKRTIQEKEEFINLFKELLKKTYADKLELYSGEEIVYENEKIDEDYALVKTKIVNKKKQTDTSVVFRLRKKGEKWLTYDVSAEGISVVNNYRVQFNDIIASSSYEDLINRIKCKK